MPFYACQIAKNHSTLNELPFNSQYTDPKFHKTTALCLLHSGKSDGAVIDHVAKGGPMSVQTLIIASSGMRAPLHEYANVSPARNWVVRASAGMVTAFTGGGTGVAQTKQHCFYYEKVDST